jgi:hypothetical protein
MIGIFFPELSHFEQPLSGEVCARVEVWKRLLDQHPPDGWGVDVWFLIEAARQVTILKKYSLVLKITHLLKTIVKMLGNWPRWQNKWNSQ